MALTQFPASVTPQRLTAGFTSDPPYGPLAESGMSNPFFYHQFPDDFDNQLTLYTASGGGTVVHTSGDGGLALLTTLAAANSFESIQLPVGDFTLPPTGANPPTTSASAKKFFYLARVQLNTSVTTESFIAGMTVITATPYTTGVQSILDGLFFYKPPNGTALQLLNIASAGNDPAGTGFTNTFTIPTAAYSLVAGQPIDLAFYLDKYQNIRAFVGSQLVGWIPQSGTGAVNAAGVPLLPVLGPVLANYNYLAQGVTPVGASSVNPVRFTTAVLSPTLAVSNGTTAGVVTMTSDFHMVQKER